MADGSAETVQIKGRGRAHHAMKFEKLISEVFSQADVIVLCFSCAVQPDSGRVTKKNTNSPI